MNIIVLWGKNVMKSQFHPSEKYYFLDFPYQKQILIVIHSANYEEKDAGVSKEGVVGIYVMCNDKTMVYVLLFLTSVGLPLSNCKDQALAAY